MRKSFGFYWFLYSVLVMCITLMFSSCSPDPIESYTHLALGTVCTIQLYEKGSQVLYDKLFARLAEIEQMVSVNISTSDIVRINEAAGSEPVPISEETFKVLKTALAFAELTNGAFNPALGPLINLWAIGSNASNLPSQQEIDDTLALCNWRDVHINSDEQKSSPTVFLAKKGMALDLGGIAKGYAADELASMLQEEGIESAIIDLGGNIYALGEKKGGDLWRVGIKNPFDAPGAPVLRIDVQNQSVVTSGVYERFFEQDGRRYHHLLDGITGYPADNGLMSVTIVTESSMIADVLATAVFVMGKQHGMDFLQSTGYKGLYIDSEKNIQATEDLNTALTVLNPEFTLRTH